MTRPADDPPFSLAAHGLSPRRVRPNLGTPELYEHAARRGEGTLTDHGALAVVTSPHTGRSPKDKFVVDEPGSTGRIWWDKNARMTEAHFDLLHEDIRAHLDQQPELFVQDLYGGADATYRQAVRFVTTNAWQALFVRNMFVRPPHAELAGFVPSFTVLHAPEMQADPARHGTRSPTFIALHFGRKQILIGGTRYAGEMKKSIFTVLNYLLPQQGVLPMHCSANVGPAGDTAIFFGLSGTGKTTLSADPARKLIGDDEHGWSDRGVFNFEGGCYAKVIRLSPEGEPEIFAATQMFGTVLENVVVDDHGAMDLNDASKTENTRAAYQLEQIENTLPEKRAGHPSSVVLLTADAFGVLPPIARLTRDQALFYFLTGFTAKLAGTEIGVTEPQPTFSCAFGAPFLPQKPTVYARMLGEKLDEHGSAVWLVNTGWTGGPYGDGQRMPIAATRALLRAALDGELDQVEFRLDPIFGFEVPVEVPGVDSSLLDPRSTWSDPDAYDEKARYLATRFRENFQKFGADENIVQAGPRV
jgi:phosphoenolpyruvate carboxykinase (ATP)